MSKTKASPEKKQGGVKEGLREYRRKRDFGKTSEPRGGTATRRKELAYVIQKHAASHLHYDLRLEVDGVLKSWAVPKGPDLNPSQKRLAMQVEDHPVEYGTFEGTIRPGEYGGGTVMLWDRGTWEPVGDARKDLREGHLKFILHGEKLHGRWMLVRRGGRKPAFDERVWFFFKERDEFADSKTSITVTKPLSVASGRDLDEIAALSERTWGPNGEDRKKGSQSINVATAKKRSVKTKSAVETTAHKSVAAKGRKPNLTGAKCAATSAIKLAATKKGATKSRATAKATDSTEFAGVRLTHPDKVLYPEVGITKQELAEYYLQVAKWMLPYIANRPLAVVRCPAGCGKTCFFQKHPGEGASDRLLQVDVSEKGPAEYNLAVKDEAGLIALVQMGVLEIHTWGSHANQLERPDQLIFDLDPDPSVEWPDVVNAARETRLVLKDIGLVSFLKTTGGKGLHIVAPIQPRIDWDEAKAFCKSVADLMVRAAPDRYIATMSKAARKGKIFIDYLRNGRGATAIAPYSTRAHDGASISMPIAWEELTSKLKSDHFNVLNATARLAKRQRDPWADLLKTKQSLTAKMRQKLEV